MAGDGEGPFEPGYNVCGSGSPAFCEQVGESELRQGHLLRARRYFEGACEHNDPLACLRLANLDGERGDWSAVVAPARKACLLGVADACSLQRRLDRPVRIPAQER